MEEIRMLGTGHAIVKNCYNTCFALKKEEEFFLVDAGGGSQILTQLDTMDISLLHIHHFFISHTHTDHITGSIWVIRMICHMMMAGKYQGLFHIYGHDLVISCIQSMCDYMLGKPLVNLIGDRIILHTVENGEQFTILEEQVTFFDIYSTKMKQYGFVIQESKLIFAGDEPYNHQCDPYTKGMEILLHEAFCLESESHIYHPERAHHSTPVKAARVASELGVRMLILYHTEDHNYKTKAISYKKEAESIFKGTVVVPCDLEVIKLV